MARSRGETMTDEKRVRCWHFLQADRRLRWGTREVVEVGKTYTAVGELLMCHNGMHGSRKLLDALGYAPGPVVCEVEIWGEVQECDAKVVGRNRKVLSMFDATDVLWKFAEAAAAAWAAWDASWNAVWPTWDAAGAAAASAASAAGAVAGAAAQAAVWPTWDAAGAAARAAWDAAWDAAGAAAQAAAWAAWDAARDAARAAWDAAWDAAREKQNRRLTRMIRKAIKDAYREGAEGAKRE